MADKKKHDEAVRRLKAAERSLKTNIFKWRPDYEVAAKEFSNAGTCFKACKSYELSKECFIKGSDCYKNIRSLFNAAKCMDQAVIVGKEANAYKEVAALAERACCLHQQCGAIEAALASLERAAKILEINYPQESLSLYQRATDISISEDDLKQAGEYASKISRLMIKLKLYDQAADAIRREIALHRRTENSPAVGRLASGLVLVQLARGDIIAAEKAYKEWGNCCAPPEVQNLELLLRGFDDEDPEAVKRALNHSFFRHMDVEYTRLIKEIALPVGSTGPKPAIVKENAAAPYVSFNTAEAGPSTSGAAAAAGDVHEEGAVAAAVAATFDDPRPTTSAIADFEERGYLPSPKPKQSQVRPRDSDSSDDDEPEPPEPEIPEEEDDDDEECLR